MAPRKAKGRYTEIEKKSGNSIDGVGISRPRAYKPSIILPATSWLLFLTKRKKKLAMKRKRPRCLDADGNNSSRERKVICRSTEDIISNLPCNIIDSILTCLPIQDAARTTVLSRKWRFKWFSISKLVFDSEVSDIFRSVSSTSPQMIWSLIFQILLVHHGPLQKILIDVDEQVKNVSSLLDQIILFLTRKDIKKFSLFAPDMETAYALPSTLFLCAHLATLCLCDCILRLSSEYIGFSNLTKLRLCMVQFTGEDITTFLSKCPLLKNLHLDRCGMETHIEIDAPNLNYLYFDCPKMSIFLKNAPVISTLIIKRSARLLGSSSNTVDVFASLPAISYFATGRQFLMDLTAGVVLERLPVMLNRLEYVELNELDFNSLKEVQFVLLMTRSCPNLRKLKIQLEEYNNNVDDVPIKSLYLVDDSINRLCEVVMEDFVGTVRELEFIEFLLAKSLVLKKVVIHPLHETSDRKLIEILKAVTQFQRASTKAQIIFLDSLEVEEVDDDE